MVLSSYESIKSQLKKCISVNPTKDDKILSLLHHLEIILKCTSNQVKMEELFLSGLEDSNNLVGNVIECNGAIDGIKKKYSEIMYNKNPQKLEKLREDEGVMVFEEEDGNDELGQDAEYIYIPKSMSLQKLASSEHHEDEMTPMMMNYPSESHDESEVEDEDQEISDYKNSQIQRI